MLSVPFILPTPPFPFIAIFHSAETVLIPIAVVIPLSGSTHVPRVAHLANRAHRLVGEIGQGCAASVKLDKVSLLGSCQTRLFAG